MKNNNDIIAPLIKTTELFACTHFMVASGLMILNFKHHKIPKVIVTWLTDTIMIVNSFSRRLDKSN